MPRNTPTRPLSAAPEFTGRLPACLLMAGLALGLAFTGPARADAPQPPGTDTAASPAPRDKPLFPDVPALREIQTRLNQAAGTLNPAVIFHVLPDDKRRFEVTRGAVHVSFGVLRRMATVEQLIAIMAHATAHQALRHTPDRPADQSPPPKGMKPTVGEYIISGVRPEYPDRSDPPEADAGYTRNAPEVKGRPLYQNPDYELDINKRQARESEEELTADQAALKIMAKAGFCPTDYREMLRYFYDHPDKLLGLRHFALESHQWHRLDALDRLDIPACTPAQTAQTRAYDAAFDTLKARMDAAEEK